MKINLGLSDTIIGDKPELEYGHMYPCTLGFPDFVGYAFN